MGVLVEAKRKKWKELLKLDPKRDELTMTKQKMRRKSSLNGCTRICGKRLGGVVVRGERLIKCRDIWFSAKYILVKCYNKYFKWRVKRWFVKGGSFLYRGNLNWWRFIWNYSNRTRSDKVFSRERNSSDCMLWL